MVEHRTGNTSGTPSTGGQAARGGSGSIPDQAQSAVRSVADSASELWDGAYEQGERYYRQGSRAVGNLDATTLSGLFVAGAVGFGLAWLLFGQQHRTDNVARRMSQSSDHYRQESDRPHRRP